jgi:hypothetical protein
MAEKAASSFPQLLDQVGRILEAKKIAWATIGALAVAYVQGGNIDKELCLKLCRKFGRGEETLARKLLST